MEHSDHVMHSHHDMTPSGHTLKDFYPLIGIVTLVLIFTSMQVYYFEASPMLAFMGWFFMVFGGLKAIRLKGFAEAYQVYDVLAKRSTAYSYVYPFLELGFGLAYLLAWQVQAVSIVVFPVMLIGALGVYLKLREKEEIPCACLGTVFTVPMTWVTLIEDLLMAGMALAIII